VRNLSATEVEVLLIPCAGTNVCVREREIERKRDHERENVFVYVSV